ncbi:hypothetical protein C6P42_000792 [Pichia californica]|nr:hypothetical protein C6P42_000792 [[Candida] californica]
MSLRGVGKALYRTPHQLFGQKTGEDVVFKQWEHDIKSALSGLEYLKLENHKWKKFWIATITNFIQIIDIFRDLHCELEHHKNKGKGKDNSKIDKNEEFTSITIHELEQAGKLATILLEKITMITDNASDSFVAKCNGMIETLKGAEKLITKRYHKKIDYDMSTNKVDSSLKNLQTDKDRVKLETQQEKLTETEIIYEDLNDKIKIIIPEILSNLSEFINKLTFKLYYSNLDILEFIQRNLEKFDRIHGISNNSKLLLYDDIISDFNGLYSQSQSKLESLGLFKEFRNFRNKNITEKTVEQVNNVAGTVVESTVNFTSTIYTKASKPNQKLSMSLNTFKIDNPVHPYDKHGMFTTALDPIEFIKSVDLSMQLSESDIKELSVDYTEQYNDTSVNSHTNEKEKYEEDEDESDIDSDHSIGADGQSVRSEKLSVAGTEWMKPLRNSTLNNTNNHYNNKINIPGSGSDSINTESDVTSNFAASIGFNSSLPSKERSRISSLKIDSKTETFKYVNVTIDNITKRMYLVVTTPQIDAAPVTTSKMNNVNQPLQSVNYINSFPKHFTNAINNNFDDTSIRTFRRKHKNSKNGCLICKQRKIKCDENLPICLFCEKRGLSCSYSTITPFQAHIIIESHAKRNKRPYKQDNATTIYDLNYSFSQKSNKLDKSIYNETSISSSENSLDFISDNEICHVGNHNYSNNNETNNYSVYNVNDFEGFMLPKSMRNNMNLNNNNNNNIFSKQQKQDSEYIRIKSVYSPNEFQDSNYNNNNTVINLDLIPLYPNFKKSNRIFNINKKFIILTLDEFIENSMTVLKSLHKNDLNTIQKLHKGKSLDTVLIGNFYKSLNISQLFDNLLRNSFLLLSIDYYKNTILKQRILKWVNYKTKIKISCECENSSLNLIDKTISLIKSDYLPYFHEFSIGLVTRFAGCFFVLNDCLGYHFKSGYKYEMSIEDSNNAVKSAGIFITGLYSIIMEKSRDEILTSGLNIISAHIISIFKKLLIKGYPIKIIDEFRRIIDKFSNIFANNIDFENLKLFCEKHSKFLSLNINENSLLGYNNYYLIKILNSFQKIVPFDAYNLSINEINKFKDRENEIVIYLFYYTLGYILDAIVSAPEVSSTGSFIGTGWNMRNFDNIPELVQFINIIKDKKLKLTSIYLIRTITFLKNRRTYYMNYLSNFTIDDLLDEDDDLTINQRYLRLRKFKEDGIMNEIYLKSLLIDKGNFIEKDNYPSVGNKKYNKNLNNIKIMNYFNDNEDLLIEDFIKNNNGMFSLDYDASNDLSNNKAIAQRAVFVDGFQIKVLWKLSRYIRINNL